MLDTIKSYIYDITIIEELKKHTLLSWKSSKEWLKKFDDEVIDQAITREYKGILFSFYENRVEVLLKLHYYFNDNLHNANDFTAQNCMDVINELKSKLGIDLNTLTVKNIEFGVNIISPILIEDLITYISYHGKNPFHSIPNLSFAKVSAKPKRNGTLNKYKSIKVYGKGIQYPFYIDKNTVRIEIKSKEAKYFNRFGIYTMNDLLCPEVYNELARALLLEYDEILILDNYTDFGSLSNKDRHDITKYNNPLEWYSILKKYRNCFSTNKRIYYSLINKVNKNLREELRGIILKKLNELRWCSFHSI